MTSLKPGFLSDLKTHIAGFPDNEFFLQLMHEQAFSFSRCQEKIIKFYTYINKNCEFIQTLCTDFLVQQFVSWMFPLTQRKFTMQKPRNTVQKSGRVKNKPSISIISCQLAPTFNMQVPKESSILQSNAVSFYYYMQM